MSTTRLREPDTTSCGHHSYKTKEHHPKRIRRFLAARRYICSIRGHRPIDMVTYAYCRICGEEWDV